jgi:phosphoenolpyruvate synthase/pyruvate phosphate dikinase
MNIVWLDEQACHNSRMAGGKAATLSRLAAIFRIPPGFCLTTAAFD